MTFCIRRLYFCSVQCGVLCKHSRFCYHSHGETSQIQHQRWFVQRWFFYEVSRILKDHNLMHILYKCCFFFEMQLDTYRIRLKVPRKILRDHCVFFITNICDWINHVFILSSNFLYCTNSKKISRTKKEGLESIWW